jgi:hypothetical protein
VVAAACHNEHFGTIWRTSLGIGVVFPLILFVLRLRLKEPEEFTRNSMKYAKIPYWLVIKFYGFRLFVVSLIWFIYDVSVVSLNHSHYRSWAQVPGHCLHPVVLTNPQFSTYAFGIYSSPILSGIYGDDSTLTTVFGWNTVINLFYIPGTMLGAPFSDWVGPRWALITGVTAQAIVGYGMAGGYAHLAQPSNVAGFAVVYGIFLSLGELGPGNNIGLIAAKTSATGVRGQYYGVAAAVGKIGAFVGTWVFPYIQAAGGNDTQSAQYPFWVSSSLCVFSALLALFFLPHIGQDTIQLEDARFRAYLEENGYDTRQLGLRKGESLDSLESATVQPAPEKTM